MRIRCVPQSFSYTWTLDLSPPPLNTSYDPQCQLPVLNDGLPRCWIDCTSCWYRCDYFSLVLSSHKHKSNCPGARAQRCDNFMLMVLDELFAPRFSSSLNATEKVRRECKCGLEERDSTHRWTRKSHLSLPIPYAYDIYDTIDSWPVSHGCHVGRDSLFKTYKLRKRAIPSPNPQQTLSSMAWTLCRPLCQMM